ncbi:MAG: response regulator [Armatimonadetes bacterium]|nr:response regulator [Armatimonadota bacterium]
MASPRVILLAEDDQDDFFLTCEAFTEAGLKHDLRRVRNGVELLEYLLGRGAYQPGQCPSPALIMLDLNMPKMDGREALVELKAHPHLSHIPVVVVTTSRSEDDVKRCYQLGASSYIRKPPGFDELVNMVTLLSRYWFEQVELPPPS